MNDDSTTGDVIDIADDDALGAALRAEVPERGAGYWARIDDQLADAAGDGRAADTINIGTDTAAGLARSRRRSSRVRSWPALAAAAALLLVAILFGSRVLTDSEETIDAGFATTQDQAIAALQAMPGPAQNRDHWNAVYAVWDCTANDGTGDWLPAFTSSDDEVGIHSHGDGLISIHPFLAQSAGRNATFAHFADAMRITVDVDAITLDDGRMLAAGTLCNGEPAAIHLRRWQDAPSLEADPSIAPRIVTENFGAERFYNDLEVWTIALAPRNADLPLPPRDRFDELANWWFPTEETGGRAMPTPDNLDGSAETRPAHDTFTTVWRAETGADADDAVNELLAWAPEESSFPLGGVIPGSGSRWIALNHDTRTVVHITTFDTTNDESQRPAFWTCQAIAFPEIEMLKSGGCGPGDSSRPQSTQIKINAEEGQQAIALSDATEDALWLVVETEGGTALANVVDGISYVAWPTEFGLWKTVDVLDTNLQVVWSETCRLPLTQFCLRD